MPARSARDCYARVQLPLPLLLLLLPPSPPLPSRIRMQSAGHRRSLETYAAECETCQDIAWSSFG